MASTASGLNVNTVVAQVIGALQQSQGQTTPPPSTIPRDLLATAEILGQEPGLRRPLGAAGNAVFDAWAQAAAEAAKRLTILRGNGQVAPVGTDVRVAPAVTVTDGFGLPIQGVRVTFTVTPGSGSVAPGFLNTGQDGVASLIAWTLGTTPGPNQLQAKVVGSPPAGFVAVAVPPIRRCEILKGDGQEGAPGKPLTIEPEVRVVDAATGQPLPGLSVAFAASADGGVENAATVTDAGGIATSGVWTLGAAGTNTLDVTVEGADAVAFTAQAIAPPVP